MLPSSSRVAVQPGATQGPRRKKKSNFPPDFLGFFRIFCEEHFWTYVPTPNFDSFWVFWAFKTEYRPFSAFIGRKGRIRIAYSLLSDMKALAYEVTCLAKISGFRDYPQIIRLRTSDNAV